MTGIKSLQVQCEKGDVEEENHGEGGQNGGERGRRKNGGTNSEQKGEREWERNVSDRECVWPSVCSLQPHLSDIPAV